MKAVINKCYGGFGLSAEAIIKLVEKGSSLVHAEQRAGHTKAAKNLIRDGYYKSSWGTVSKDGITYSANSLYTLKERCHPDLVAVVEELGEDVASGDLAELKIVNIPDDIDSLEITEYDGIETIRTKSEVWG